MAGCWLILIIVTIPWWRLSARCIRSKIRHMMMRTGIYFGQMAPYSVIGFIEWSLIRGSTIFLAWMFLVARICLPEIWWGCKKSSLRIMILFLRHGYYHRNMPILENSLKTFQKIKRKLLSLNRKLLAKEKEFFFQETLKI